MVTVVTSSTSSSVPLSKKATGLTIKTVSKTPAVPIVPEVASEEAGAEEVAAIELRRKPSSA